MTSAFVVGHVNPDADSIASAIGYAWLLRERDGMEITAGRAGPINLQTNWVLKRLNLDTPTLLTDASPRFESVVRRYDTTTPEEPLRVAWEIASKTGGIAPVLDENGKPYGLINGKSLFDFLNRLVGPNPQKTEIQISEMLDFPCKEAADTNVAQFNGSTRIKDVLNRVLRVEGDEFWVVDEKGLYQGICKQRDLLNPPRLKLILVDHNEPSQAIASLEEAEILEILDHHRLGNTSTRIPIRFTVDVVGSTSTLISEQIAEAGLSAPPAIAGVMLAGLLSDTLILRSPTTTDRDKKASERLSRWAFVAGSPLYGETLQSYGKQVLSAGSGITVRSPEEIVRNDLKVYTDGGYKFAIAQVEVSDLYEFSENTEEFRNALGALRDSKGLDFAMLMVTDVVRSSSRLLIVHSPAVLDDLPYAVQLDGTFLAEGVVSRKKQLLPVVLGLLEA
ncbi:MAG: DHHA2 domain-containing protein [Anaerolineaceae bacterium]|jgi:manganese-dependent inorganic pyrophosphatase